MNKFMLLTLALVGLSACAGMEPTQPYGDRTAGQKETAEMMMNDPMASRSDVNALRMCLEKEDRLKKMNKSCYRK